MDAVRKGGDARAGAGSARKCASASRPAPTAWAEAIRVGNEVESLYTNGPAGGGGAWKSAREIVAVASTLLPQHLARPAVSIEVA